MMILILMFLGYIAQLVCDRVHKRMEINMPIHDNDHIARDVINIRALFYPI